MEDNRENRRGAGPSVAGGRPVRRKRQACGDCAALASLEA
jgi:hypothetical protein